MVDNSLSDTDVEAWMRDVYDNGLTTEKIVELTHAMTHSGVVLKWPEEWAHLVVDKHSTGGVGDKVSLPLAPALAACGLRNPMIAGRGLAFTGGTIDKLESLPGYDPNLSPEQIIEQVSEIGCVIGCQTGHIAPADKRMYAIRDVSGLVASVPLITGSIVSKKAAEGLAALVMDIKVGRATFMQTEDDARALAESISSTGAGLGMRTSVTLTEMDTPIGYAIGNALEVLESVETLRGRGPADLEELICVQGGMLLALTGLADDHEVGVEQIRSTLYDGTALAKFEQMCAAQGVDSAIFENEHSLLSVLGLLDESLQTTEVRATKAGNVAAIDALALGLLSFELGAGRKSLDDSLDLQVGLLLETHIGSRLEEGDSWVTVYHRDSLSDEHLRRIQGALTLSNEHIEPSSRIIDIL